MVLYSNYREALNFSRIVCVCVCVFFFDFVQFFVFCFCFLFFSDLCLVVFVGINLILARDPLLILTYGREQLFVLNIQFLIRDF